MFLLSGCLLSQCWNGEIETLVCMQLGNFGSGKIWRVCCKTHIEERKFGEFSKPQTKNYTARLKSNFEYITENM